ncbi:MAG: membrane protein insertion efficiency factor YidD [Gemmataceae bacterium]|nr:membrane protein insertion efficiency factor YidD [Gemmataceae bacterium]
MIRAGLNAVRGAAGWLLILPVRFYQVAIGPLLPKVCRFHPSCSDYFIQAVMKHGPIRGVIKGLGRICRCHPWNRGGYDPP